MTAVQEFERLAVESRFKLLVYATALLRNQADAEDAVQQALLRAWRSLDSYASAGTLYKWLNTILYNECMLLIRHRRAAKRSYGKEDSLAYDLDPENFRSCDPDPEQLYLRDELAEVLHYEIRRLPRNFQQVLRADLATINEEGNRGYALGAAIGMNTGAAKSLLHRARKGLRERMETHQPTKQKLPPPPPPAVMVME